MVVQAVGKRQLQPDRFAATAGNLTRGAVDGPVGAAIQVELHVVFTAVDGADLRNQIAARAAEKFRIIWQQRRKESEFQFDAACRKGVDRPGRQNFAAGLLHRLAAVETGETQTSAVNPQNPQEPAVGSPPLAAPAFGLPVGKAPDAEKGVMDDQRNSGITPLLCHNRKSFSVRED